MQWFHRSDLHDEEKSIDLHCISLNGWNKIHSNIVSIHSLSQGNLQELTFTSLERDYIISWGTKANRFAQIAYYQNFDDDS